MRKQTLFGIAPVMPPLAEPKVAEPSIDEPIAAAVAASQAASASAPVAATSAANALRKQTLLGLAPYVPTENAPAPAPTVAPTAETTTSEVAEATSSVSSIVTPAAVATDAPTTTDIADLARAPQAEPRRSEPAPRLAELSSTDDLPELRPRRPRWIAPLGVAAALALGVVGLRSLDRAPQAVPVAAEAKPQAPVKPPADSVKPRSDDDDDNEPPNTGTDSQPDPIPTEPEPLKGQADSAKPSAAPAAAPSAEPEASPGAAPPAAAGIIRINVESDPPGARMFRRGKEVGTTPFVLEFEAGERRAYELGLPGYITRKVVIDGSRTDISIGLRPDSAASTGAKPRK